MKKKIFPQIKKKLQNFLLDESGKITKKDALGLAAATSIGLGMSDVFAGHTSHTSAIPGGVGGGSGHSSYAHSNGLSCPATVQTTNSLSGHASVVSAGHTSGSYTPSHTSTFSPGTISGHGSATGHSSHGSSGSGTGGGGGSCFTFTQRVLTPNGYQPIGTLQEGDIVISYNHVNNKYETSIIDIFIVHDGIKHWLNDYSKSSLLKIYIETESGKTYSIETTDIHPFYDIKSSEYKSIEKFKIGDELFMYKDKGYLKSIETIFDKNNFDHSIEKPIVYNLEMKDGNNHNYFVEGCLVHNAFNLATEIP